MDQSRGLLSLGSRVQVPQRAPITTPRRMPRPPLPISRGHGTGGSASGSYPEDWRVQFPRPQPSPVKPTRVRHLAHNEDRTGSRPVAGTTRSLGGTGRRAGFRFRSHWHVGSIPTGSTTHSGRHGTISSLRTVRFRVRGPGPEPSIPMWRNWQTRTTQTRDAEGSTPSIGTNQHGGLALLLGERIRA